MIKRDDELLVFAEKAFIRANELIAKKAMELNTSVEDLEIIFLAVTKSLYEAAQMASRLKGLLGNDKTGFGDLENQRDDFSPKRSPYNRT